MSGPGPRKKWLSKSAHWKEGQRKFSGPQPHKLRDRAGQATHYNPQPGDCCKCGNHVPAEQGYLLVLNHRTYAVMCQPCTTPS